MPEKDKAEQYFSDRETEKRLAKPTKTKKASIKGKGTNLALGLGLVIAGCQGSAPVEPIRQGGGSEPEKVIYAEPTANGSGGVGIEFPPTSEPSVTPELFQNVPYMFGVVTKMEAGSLEESFASKRIEFENWLNTEGKEKIEPLRLAGKEYFAGKGLLPKEQVVIFGADGKSGKWVLDDKAGVETVNLNAVGTWEIGALVDSEGAFILQDCTLKEAEENGQKKIQLTRRGEVLGETVGGGDLTGFVYHVALNTEDEKKVEEQVLLVACEGDEVLFVRVPNVLKIPEGKRLAEGVKVALNPIGYFEFYRESEDGERSILVTLNYFGQEPVWGPGNPEAVFEDIEKTPSIPDLAHLHLEGNTLKTEQGEYAGEIIEYIFNGEKTKGVVLIPSEGKKLMEKANTPQAIAKGNWKIAFPLDARGEGRLEIFEWGPGGYGKISYLFKGLSHSARFVSPFEQLSNKSCGGNFPGYGKGCRVEIPSTMVKNDVERYLLFIAPEGEYSTSGQDSLSFGEVVMSNISGALKSDLVPEETQAVIALGFGPKSKNQDYNILDNTLKVGDMIVFLAAE